MDSRSTWIEPIDLFGLGRLWTRDGASRECLQDQARYDAGDRMQAAIEMGAPGCKHSRLVIDVSQDAGGRWWSGYSWICWHVPDGISCGQHTPIDAYRAATRDDAVRLAAAGLLASLPPCTTPKAARIMAHWRRELPARAGLPPHA